MKHVEVFTTNVGLPDVACPITTCLGSLHQGAQVSFDLDDVDRVLRIASQSAINASIVINIVALFGFEAEVMKDEVEASMTLEL